MSYWSVPPTVRARLRRLRDRVLQRLGVATTTRAGPSGLRALLIVGDLGPLQLNGLDDDPESRVLGSLVSSSAVEVPTVTVVDDLTVNVTADGAPVAVDGLWAGLPPRPLRVQQMRFATSPVHLQRVSPVLTAAALHRGWIDIDEWSGTADDARWAARTLCQLTASGVLVTGQPSPELANALPGALLSVLQRLTSRAPGPEERERVAVASRRAALEHAGGLAFASRVAGIVGGHVANASVSVLLATRRPSHLMDALRQVGAQTSRPSEVVVGLHGVELDPTHAAQLDDVAGCTVHVARIGADRPLGLVLDELLRRASGTVITKWDDDDWYAAEHLQDLLDDLRETGADLVGKAAAFVYLEGAGRTIRRFAGSSHAASTTIAGGALMALRSTVLDLGGWPGASRAVDRALIDRLVRFGGRTYRTHDYGYVLRRSSKSTYVHTWDAADEYFLQQASMSRPGLDLDVAHESGRWTGPVSPGAS